MSVKTLAVGAFLGVFFFFLALLGFVAFAPSLPVAMH